MVEAFKQWIGLDRPFLRRSPCFQKTFRSRRGNGRNAPSASSDGPRCPAGDFAAMEEPELLVDDIRAFFRPLRSTVGAGRARSIEAHGNA